jgi:hypothetical protein
MTGIALLGLVGCDKLGIPSGNTSSSAAATDSDAGKKLNGYIEAYNALLGTWGLEDKAKDYRDSNIPNGAPGGEFRVKPGWIGQALDKLRAARAMSGGSPEMDGAADALLASAGKVQAHLASLQTYYDGKKYLDDKFARGRAENPPMLAEIDAAEKDLAAFGKLLDAAIEQRDVALIDTLKGTDPVAYNIKLALIHSKKLLALFNGQEHSAKPELIAKGDVEVAIIEKAIADGQKEASKQGKATPHALDVLNSMLGYYREFKQDHDPDHLNLVLTYYNSAVEDANH